MVAVSKVTSKYQATIPAEIRHDMGISKGDTVIFIHKGNDICIKKAEQPIDIEYLKAVEKNMTEWFSSEDEEAFNDW